jgi:hypothetical protein
MAGAAASCDPYACQASGSSSTDDSCLAKCGTVAQCANDNLACENTRCGLPDGSGCKQAAPGDCASTFCAIATAGPTCCSTACNTCTVDGNFTNHLPDCTGGRCAVGTATCGQFLCDKNAQCLKSCHCPIDPTTGKPMTNCRADGSSADAAPECVSGTYCSPMFTPTYVCHLG